MEVENADIAESVAGLLSSLDLDDTQDLARLGRECRRLRTVIIGCTAGDQESDEDEVIGLIACLRSEEIVVIDITTRTKRCRLKGYKDCHHIGCLVSRLDDKVIAIAH